MQREITDVQSAKSDPFSGGHASILWLALEPFWRKASAPKRIENDLNR